MSSVTPQITGRSYWRSLEEHADTPEFRELLGYAGTAINDENPGYSRRRFLQIMGASMSLAGLTLTGCRRWPEQHLAPYASRPEGRMPGEPEYFATIIERGGVAHGLLVESFDGRPIKIEGNPQHPFSLGATETWDQASVLSLYDPDRSRAVVRGAGDGKASKWQDFQVFAGEHFAARRGAASKAVAVLAEPSDSPSRQAMKKRLQAAYPEANWYDWEPVNRDNERAGSRLAFGQALRGQYHLDKASVVACFDADPLQMHAAGLLHARQWAQGRRAENGKMNRVYVAEPTFTTTGSVADERLPVKASKVPALVHALAVKLGVIRGEAVSLNGSTDFIEKLAADLQRHRGASVVMVGPGQSAGTHALAWAINERLNNLGQTITLVADPAGDAPTQLAQITELTRRMNAGEIDTLVILGGNPVYNAPADLKFSDALAKVATTIHLSYYRDETSRQCQWHLPEAHYLEGWGDGRAWDGTVSIQQPLILPIFDGKTSIELLALLLGESADGYEIVRRTFAEQFLAGVGDFEAAWRKALHDGVLEGSQWPAEKSARVAIDQLPTAAPALPGDAFEIVFQADPGVYDGRWANNGWLQELPGAMTKLTWDNAVLIAVADAKRQGIKQGNVLKLTVSGRELALPALLMPGQAHGSAVVTLGFGRTAAGRVGDGVGQDTYTLRTTAALHSAPATVERTGEHFELATTTNHHLIEGVGRDAINKRIGEQGQSGIIIKEATLAEFNKRPNFAQADAHGNVSLQLFETPMQYNDPHAWGMTIDMNACIGCNACVVACQAENNIPIVGPKQVRTNREMHWIRIDRYFKGDPEGSPEVVHQPVMCVHCENAPCEQVCPVNASVHDSEGLNLQVYNRCIGTRYCSNNCPYKVRRFNFLDYHSQDPRSKGFPKPWLDIPDRELSAKIDGLERMQFNPDVTVRMRGVMEKCTYCVQRISRAKIAADNEWMQGKRSDPLVQDGEVMTACQQSCPTQAIVFGNIGDPKAQVTQLQKSPRAYSLLHELNTRPRSKHLAKLRNPAEGEVSSS